MQCKHCKENDFEYQIEDFQEGIGMTVIEIQIRCRPCGAMHLRKIHWADFDCVPLPKKEMVLQ